MKAWSKLKGGWRRIRYWHDQDKLKSVSDPFADWQKLCVLTMILIVAVTLIHYLLLRHFDNPKSNPAAPPGVPTRHLDLATLKAVSREIETRAQLFETTLDEKPPAIDPGL